MATNRIDSNETEDIRWIIKLTTHGEDAETIDIEPDTAYVEEPETDTSMDSEDVMEESIEPEANFEVDIDASKLAEIAEGAEETVELIATIL